MLNQATICWVEIKYNIGTLARLFLALINYQIYLGQTLQSDFILIFMLIIIVNCFKINDVHDQM